MGEKDLSDTAVNGGVVLGAGLDFPLNKMLSLGVHYKFYYTAGSKDGVDTGAMMNTLSGGLKFSF